MTGKKHYHAGKTAAVYYIHPGSTRMDEDGLLRISHDGVNTRTQQSTRESPSGVNVFSQRMIFETSMLPSILLSTCKNNFACFALRFGSGLDDPIEQNLQD